MKTTLDLPDALLIEAKAVAAKRRTTLRAMVEHALRREIRGLEDERASGQSLTEMNEFGFPVLKRSSTGTVTSADVYAFLENEDE